MARHGTPPRLRDALQRRRRRPPVVPAVPDEELAMYLALLCEGPRVTEHQEVSRGAAGRFRPPPS